MRYIVMLVLGVAIVAHCWGCASLKEAGKGFIGVSTKEIEAGRVNAITQQFPLDYKLSHLKVEDALKAMGAHIYAQDTNKGMIAAYVSSEDTTPVGIFLKPVDVNTTEVAVSSPSTSTKEIFAKQLFDKLQESDSSQIKESGYGAE
ncbi:MAG: hypothetical protein KBA46_06580 [Candidatus Omnitrophica bacterium]|nr:hypothetical protein [Candidatus Omnitrophota bacterium]